MTSLFAAAITFNEDYYDFDGNLVGLPNGDTGLSATGTIEVWLEAGVVAGYGGVFYGGAYYGG